MSSIQDIVDSNHLLYPSLFTSFLSKNVNVNVNVKSNDVEVLEIIPSKLIQERIYDAHCSVPVIIQNIDANEPMFFADKKKKNW